MNRVMQRSTEKAISTNIGLQGYHFFAHICDVQDDLRSGESVAVASADRPS